MIHTNIPGFGELLLEHAVFDYNGTLALDGLLLPHVREKLLALAETMNIRILTADTFGSVRGQCGGFPFTIHIIDAKDESE